MLLEVERRRDGALAASRAVDERGQRPIAVGPDDEAHVLRFLEQLRPEALRHAPGHAHDRVGLHVPLELTEAADHPLLRVIANRARVEQDDVRTVGGIDGLIAAVREPAEHQLGIAHVHLAAVGLDVDRGACLGHQRMMACSGTPSNRDASPSSRARHRVPRGIDGSTATVR